MPTPNDEPTEESTGESTEELTNERPRPKKPSRKPSDDIDIYPMPMFVQFAVGDVDASTDWYRDTAGFRTVAPLPEIAHLRYRKYADVMLVPSDETGAQERPPERNGMSLYLNVADERVDDVFERAQSHDATVVSEPAETLWNTRELVLADPDGYRLVFTEPIDTDLEFDAVIGDHDSE